TEYWEPIFRACAETDTVISLHVGSSGMIPQPADATRESYTAGWTLFGMQSAITCAEWLFSGWLLDFPTLKVTLAEGGIGWVAQMIERMDKLATEPYHIVNFEGTAIAKRLATEGMTASDLLRRNFWFCTIDEAYAIESREIIGVENILAELDYPHPDSSWP